jgi:GTP pyrophosphokinase
LLAVAAIALEHGADEEEAVAALLHDSVEDHGASLRPEIESRFGSRVLAIVDGCSDAQGHPKPPWKDRKIRYIRQVACASPSIQLVSASDKLHNLRSLIRDYRSRGENLWGIFSGGKDGTLWYYRELAGVYGTVPPALMRELSSALAELESMVARTGQDAAQG